jgi:RNA polymerase sigma factor (sigma-70 family)
MPAMPTTTAPRFAAVNRASSDPISVALERLLYRYAALVRQAACRHGLSASDVDEVFQDVRIRLWRALATDEKIAQTPASYVYRTAMSAALDLIRRRRARSVREIGPVRDSTPASPAEWPGAAVEESELLRTISLGIQVLNRPRRVVVRLYLAGYHRHEIAERLGWTEAKTRNLLYRGLADLRDRLGDLR